MTGQKHYFSSLSEKEFGFEILLGGDYAYHPKGVGTVKFERGSGKPLHLSGVLCSTTKEEFGLSVSSRRQGL
jgi:hypothetical protein